MVECRPADLGDTLRDQDITLEFCKRKAPAREFGDVLAQADALELGTAVEKSFSECSDGIGDIKR